MIMTVILIEMAHPVDLQEMLIHLDHQDQAQILHKLQSKKQKNLLNLQLVVKKIKIKMEMTKNVIQNLAAQEVAQLQNLNRNLKIRRWERRRKRNLKAQAHLEALQVLHHLKTRKRRKSHHQRKKLLLRKRRKRLKRRNKTINLGHQVVLVAHLAQVVVDLVRVAQVLQVALKKKCKG